MQPTGAQNVIVGDEDFGTSLPETRVDETQLNIIKNLAKFSKTREFQKLKEHLESRIKFYQSNLPDGRPISDIDLDQMGTAWSISNAVIGEMQAIIDVYEGSAEEVKNATDPARS